MSADLTKYLDRLTSEHSTKPNFLASVTALLQPVADTLAVIQGLPQSFDLDSAVGSQLDVVGQWIGISRYISIPDPSIYFSFDIDTLGFDQGIWFAPGDDTSGLFALPDDSYRLLLKARALNNQWDGSIPQAYAVWDALFAGTGHVIIIIDNGDLSMALGLVGDPPDVILKALFTGGYLDLKPVGVRISAYLIPTALGPPFALDAPPPLAYAGLDTGVWTDVYTP